MRGGVTTPDELRRIAYVADKYNVRMLKVTGSQRLDLLGVKKEDLPKIWADLGMPSGQAYTKGVRMVKTCVGTSSAASARSTRRLPGSNGAALRESLHAAQGEDGGGRLPAQLR
jgi:NAD(P)H-nitrite reductase large subunit